MHANPTSKSSSPDASKPSTFSNGTLSRLLALRSSIDEVKELHKSLPTLSEIVTIRDRSERMAVTEQLSRAATLLSACDKQLAAIKRERRSSEIRNELKAISKDVAECRWAVEDLQERAKPLFSVGVAGLRVVPELTQAQLRELVASVHEAREGYWRELFSVPCVMRDRIGQLRRHAAGEYGGPRAIFRPRWDTKADEEVQRQSALAVSEYDQFVASYGEALPHDSRRIVAAKLAALPLLPEEALEVGSIVRKKTERFVELETLLGCRLNAERMRGEQLDSAKREYASLAHDLGNNALVARSQLAALDAALEPYTALKDYALIANLPFVFYVLRERFEVRGTDGGDVVQGGAIGLMKAIERFDLSSQMQFSTCAEKWIRQSAREACRLTGPVVVIPSHAYDTFVAIRKSSEGTRDEAFVKSLAKQHRIDPETVYAIGRVGNVWQSLDGSQIKRRDSDTNVRNTLTDPRSVYVPDRTLDSDMVKKMQDAVAVLPWRDREIISMRFGLQMERSYSLQEVSVRFGVSRERIRQIEERVIGRLREELADAQIG